MASGLQPATVLVRSKPVCYGEDFGLSFSFLFVDRNTFSFFFFFCLETEICILKHGRSHL